MATLQARITALAAAIAAESKSHKLMINGNAADLTALLTSNKSNLVAAVNELKGLLDDVAEQAGNAAVINDQGTGADVAWSAQKIALEIQAAKNALTNGASSALDTLAELAAAIGNDANFASTVTVALGNRVRFDAAQTLTPEQQAQARANIGAVAAADIGNPDTDFAAVFTAGLA
jgi:hypothetical protein